ncbi:MAG TPA: hypothetical protein VF832_12085 [Longimicrobiales bacterium]
MRRELATAGLCLLLALLVNAGAIVAYRTHWIELLTTSHLTLLLALVLYVVWGVLRLAWTAARRRLPPWSHRSGVPDSPRRPIADEDGSAAVPGGGASRQQRQDAHEAEREVGAASGGSM